MKLGLIGRTTRRTLTLSVVGLGLVAGVAYASIPGTDGVIHGCYSKKSGAPTVIDSTKTCPSTSVA